MGYKIKKNDVPVYKLSETWHFKHDSGSLNSYDSNHKDFMSAKNALENNIRNHNVQLIHFISKNFGLVFNK